MAISSRKSQGRNGTAPYYHISPFFYKGFFGPPESFPALVGHTTGRKSPVREEGRCKKQLYNMHL